MGDHSVGKSGLAHRILHGKFKEQASSHGQQFWVLPELGGRRGDGTECEAILWDFAGQPDYRLVHALFLDDADLALVLFDSSDLRDPLHGVEFWIKQLCTGGRRVPIVLVAAQVDRGTSPLTVDELAAFCRQRGIAGPVRTSALTGEGVDELLALMKTLVRWEDKPATVTTVTFKRIKDYVLSLKQREDDETAIVTAAELRQRLQSTDPAWEFGDDEMMTAIGHLENYGYVKRLRTSSGEQRILLTPDRLNNLASSLVLEARRNPKGLGALEEWRLLRGGYDFRELASLASAERTILLDTAVALFLEHNICFREIDPLRTEPYLIFPELINLKKPPDETIAFTAGATYVAGGATENVFASLVVLMGYTHTFTRTHHWQNHARYEVGGGSVCGFQLRAERDAELELVLYYGVDVPAPVRALFQSLFENFLSRRNLTVTRFEPVVCLRCATALDSGVIRQRLKDGHVFTFCNNCGERLALQPQQPIQLTNEQRAQLAEQHRAADQRTRFEQVLFRLQGFAASRGRPAPRCFISYAWDKGDNDRWVESSLATDLQKAGIGVLLDRWENSRIGSSLARFVEQIEECDYVVIVGTPLYKAKAKNASAASPSIAAAEWDVAGIRMLGTETAKRTVLPVLRDGEEASSFPALLRGRVYADFRDERQYFPTAFSLVLSIYDIQPNDPGIADLRASLVDQTLR